MQQVSQQLSNATYQPPASILATPTTPPFRPSPNDIRVNVLWFASLIFSLITASFGILVKQWLREYLAVTYPSPYARLRIRHYREPGLIQWQVFEIAAVLPLLQQLSLALFFIGLCYFTASVHESVGNTSLPLVAAWGFCLLVVTILPVFFPRCPYKTTLLKSLHILWAIEAAADWLYDWRPLQYVRKAGKLQWLHDFSWALYKHRLAHEESEIITKDKSDLHILSNVDILQSNDELLGTTIFESLQQIHQPRWVDIVDFVLQVLDHRLQAKVPLSGSPRPLNLRPLSRSAYVGVIDILSYYASMHLLKPGQQTSTVSRWEASDSSMHALYIFFSPSRHPLPRSGVGVFAAILQPHRTELIRVLVRGCLKPKKSTPRLGLLLEGIKQRADDLGWSMDYSLHCLETLINAVFDHYREDSDSEDRLPAGPFKLQGDVSKWPWEADIWIPKVCHEATKFIADVIRRDLRSSQHLNSVDHGLTKHTALPDFEVEDGMIALSATGVVSHRLIGALGCMWHLVNLFKEHYYLSAFRSAIGDCLSRKDSTTALLTALCHTPMSAISGVWDELATENYALKST